MNHRGRRTPPKYTRSRYSDYDGYRNQVPYEERERQDRMSLILAILYVVGLVTFLAMLGSCAG